MSGTRGGGRGRGRGGGVAGRKHKIAGQEMEWEYDPDVDSKSEPQEMFPSMKEAFPRPDPPTRRERAAAQYHIAIRKRIHKSPLHTVLSAQARVSKGHQSTISKTFDPFVDLPSYSQKYKQPQRELPRFNTRVYPVHLFPEELQSVIDSSRKWDPSKTNARRRPKRVISRDEEEEETEKRKPDAEDEEQEEQSRGRDEDEEPEELELDPDENFEDDEDEMAGDYNAEAYFSGGEGDDEDLGMGDEGGGADFD